MKRHILIIGCICWLFSLQLLGASIAGVHYTKDDSLTIMRLLAMPPADGAATLFFANQFIGRPYVAHTLELFPDREQLIVNTRQLDCTTLVETVAALTICQQRHLTSFTDYCQVLRQLRYRQGIIDRYPSRLHYFTEWIIDKTQMGFVSECQQKDYPFTAVQKLSIDYMSKHPKAYEALKRHPQFLPEIASQEKRLTGSSFRYIPKENVKNTKVLRNIVRDGDIIAITCNKPGLDIAHLGFALWRSDGLHLLNASLLHKKVVVEPMTLGEYLSKHPSHTGIRIIRIKN